jgi:hypothetical protein
MIDINYLILKTQYLPLPVYLHKFISHRIARSLHSIQYNRLSKQLHKVKISIWNNFTF